MKKLFVITAMLMLALPCAQEAQSQFPRRDKIKKCKLRGKNLYGKVRIVESFADFRVRVVESFGDLNVKKVEFFPDDCGEWQFVESDADFTVQFVESDADFNIRYVESFPGMP